MPGTRETPPPDAAIPPGWNYAPGTWDQRLPIILLAGLGAIIAFYMTLYQWKVIDTIWDPFFSGGPEHENGSARVLRSEISYLLPFPFTDGFLGFLAYAGDVIFGAIGGRDRWRTRPWVVIFFGILIGPVGATSVALVIAQPLGYDTFCTLCLATALISVIIIGPAMDEVLATLQYLKRVREQGRPFWRYFWGRGAQEPLQDVPAARVEDLPPPVAAPVGRKVGNQAAVYAQLAVFGTGTYLMLAPFHWGYGDSRAADVQRFLGPLIATIALCAAWEVLRNLRWLNILLALALAGAAISPWPWRYPEAAIWSDLAVAAVVIGLSCVPYPILARFSGGWRRLLPWKAG